MTKTTSEPPTAHGGCKPRRNHVLVVEDDDMVRDLAVRQLHSLGYEVTEAADGESGLEALRARPEISLLFTDIVMGKMSGLDLAMAAEQLRPDLRILLTSGSSSKNEIDRYNLDPEIEFLPKPYRRRDLAERLLKILGG